MVACTGLYADVSVEDRFSDDVAKGRIISVLTFCFRAESTFLGGFWKSNQCEKPEKRLQRRNVQSSREVQEVQREVHEEPDV